MNPKFLIVFDGVASHQYEGLRLQYVHRGEQIKIVHVTNDMLQKFAHDYLALGGMPSEEEYYGNLLRIDPQRIAAGIISANCLMDSFSMRELDHEAAFSGICTCRPPAGWFDNCISTHFWSALPKQDFSDNCYHYIMVSGDNRYYDLGFSAIDPPSRILNWS